MKKERVELSVHTKMSRMDAGPPPVTMSELRQSRGNRPSP